MLTGVAAAAAGGDVTHVVVVVVVVVVSRGLVVVWTVFVEVSADCCDFNVVSTSLT